MADRQGETRNASLWRLPPKANPSVWCQDQEVRHALWRLPPKANPKRMSVIWPRPSCGSASPTRRVTQGRPSAPLWRLPPKANPSVLNVSTVCPGYAFRRSPSRMALPWAMTRRVAVRNAG